MAEFAFLFPGQGSQQVGMGKALSEQFPVAAEIFEEADQILQFPLSKLCFEGPEEELRLTVNTQPALLTVSVAANRVLRRAGFEPVLVAGHSLGEYSALEAAGSLDFADALRLVRKRGAYMQDAVPAGVGAMAALLKMPDGKLDDILASASTSEEFVTAANFNSPDQIVIAGHAKAVERAIELAKEAGAKRAILLPVSAPFHCPLMKPAQERLAADLHATAFRDLNIPLINNWEARQITKANEALKGLYEQVPNPVRWTESIHLLSAQGITRFVEVGPGSVLTGLCRSVDPSLQGAGFGAPADLEKVQTLLS